MRRKDYPHALKCFECLLPGTGFTAVLQVNADRLVEDYPGLFQRV